MGLNSIAFAMTGAKLDSQNRYPFVVYLRVEDEPLQPVACTGTVVFPTVVITAAHCVVWEGKLRQGGRIFYGPTPDISSSKNTPFHKVIIDDHHNLNELSSDERKSAALYSVTRDLAVIILDEPADIAPEFLPKRMINVFDIARDWKEYADDEDSILIIDAYWQNLKARLATKWKTRLIGFGSPKCLDGNETKDACRTAKPKRYHSQFDAGPCTAYRNLGGVRQVVLAREREGLDQWWLVYTTNCWEQKPSHSVTHGDSGGPVFLVSKDGGEILAGAISVNDIAASYLLSAEMIADAVLENADAQTLQYIRDRGCLEATFTCGAQPDAKEMVKYARPTPPLRPIAVGGLALAGLTTMTVLGLAIINRKRQAASGSEISSTSKRRIAMTRNITVAIAALCAVLAIVFVFATTGGVNEGATSFNDLRKRMEQAGSCPHAACSQH